MAGITLLLAIMVAIIIVQAVNAVRMKISTDTAVSHALKVAVLAPKVTAPTEASPKSLSGMVRKTSEYSKEADQLVTSIKDAIDKSRDIS